MARLISRLPWILAGALVAACLGVVAGPATAALASITPLVTVTASPSPATTGAVNYQVSVTDPTGSGTPTGSVSVSDGAAGACTIAALDSNGDGNCSIEEPAGTYTVTATYSGDPNYSGATGTTTETVDQATPTVTVTPQSGATTGNVNYAVTVAGPSGAVVPTGTVSVTDGTGSCPITLSSGTGSCSIPEAAGTYTVTATYSGDPNYLGNTGSATETVNQATPVLHPAGTPGAVTGEVGFSITVAGTAGGPTPTGTVTVSIVANPSVTPCTISLSAGAGSCDLYLTPGSYSVKFAYSGDPNYLSVDNHPSFLSQKVSPAPVTVSVTTKANPAAARSTGTAKVSYTVTVEGVTGVPDPTGAVAITDGTSSCTVKSLSSGTGHCDLTESLGSYSVVATYTGDGNYAAGTGSLTEYVGTKTLTALSISGSPAAPGGSVTLTATISSVVSSASTPSGQVVFVIGGVDQSPVATSDGVATLVYDVPAGASAGTVAVSAEFQSSSPDYWFDSTKSGKFKVS